MGRDWYENCAKRFGGYRKLWDSHIEGQDGEAEFTAWLRQTVPPHPRVLDVGCGDGLYTLHLSALAEHAAGVDYSEEMIALARRNQQSAGIRNVRFDLCNTSADQLPFNDGAFDLVISRRGPTSHLREARRVLRPGGLVAGIHTGAREEIIGRIQAQGYRLLRNEAFHGVEIMPTLEDFALFMARMPGAPDYTAPEQHAELEPLAAKARTGQGYEVQRFWFIWVAEPAD